jgi:carbonic anhydrase/acetyltransferase-like protein (isoleucine patch superfamily)
VDPAAFVHPSAVLIGDVRVGPLSSIWPNATLRGDDGPIHIGERTSIQDGAVIHATRTLSENHIGSRVTVGHGAILHGVTIADDCLIGMGAILLDNVRVETGAVVAAGTLVPPGKTVPAHTLVMGNPFRIVRECGPAEAELISFGWQEYVDRIRQYRETAG